MTRSKHMDGKVRYRVVETVEIGEIRVSREVASIEGTGVEGLDRRLLAEELGGGGK